MNDSLTIDGVGPMPVERPQSVAELCAIVRHCAESKTAIYPVGGGTMLDYGMPPARPGIALSTTSLNQVIDYPARDLTITVQAGITIQKLQETLAAENQWLPIDVPSPEHATIGGAIACDVSGPRRHGYGTLRDYIIGITVVNDRGEECKAGGRVVKNVAGYDMMKLHTGALGTLGVIAQVTLRVKPRPEAWAIFSCFVAARDALKTWEAILQAKTNAQMVMFDQALEFGPEIGWILVAIFEGSASAAEWQVRHLENELAVEESKLLENYLGGDGSFGFDHRWNRKVETCVRVPISETAIVANGYLEQCDWLMTEGWAAGNVGILSLRTKSSTDEHAYALLNQLMLREIDTRESAKVVSITDKWKKHRSYWACPPADLALQKAVKRALDPHNIFNPGRFVTDAF